MSMPQITLSARTEGTSNADRVAILTALVGGAMEKEQHIDGLRQRNITVALAAFAGLFGFGVTALGGSHTIIVTVALTAVMVVFTLLDRRLHKYSHGWRRTRRELTLRLAEAANGPARDVTFHIYYSEAEKTAEWHSLQPVIYYFLCLGGALSFVAFR
jgi:hypothetical protein